MNFKWSDEQKMIFDLKNYKEGKIIVKACPGSGKTTCVSERIIQFIKESVSKQQGLAILSFTNVAIKEIENYYEKNTNKNIDYPNYIGTIDSFLNKYIFLPYGYLVMKCKKRPILVGKPHTYWSSINYNHKFFDKYSYDKEGNVKKLVTKIPKNHKFIESKKELNKKGYATQDDSNYFSMKILKEYPQIAKIIVNKFPYFIIDESQDISSIQMEILNILMENGLENIMLLGDPDQAIFEWKTAEPTLFNEKYIQWKKNHKSIILNETYRCSKEITSYLSKLSNNTIISKLRDHDNYKPVISGNKSNLNDNVKKFLEEINEKNIDKNQVAILFRSKKDLNKLNNHPVYTDEYIFKDSKKDLNYFQHTMKSNERIPNKDKVKSYSKNIIKGAFNYLNNNFKESFNEFEIAYIKVIFDKYKNINNEKIKKIEEKGYYNYKKDVFNFMKQFIKPKSKNELIDEWIVNNNEIFKGKSNNKLYINRIKTKEKSSSIKLNEKLTWDMLDYDDFQKLDDIFIGTIHSAKGKTFDAVLLILNSKCTKVLDKKHLDDEEELRNLYVGMSRAKKYLHMVVPNDDLCKWELFFESSEKQQNLDEFL